MHKLSKTTTLKKIVKLLTGRIVIAGVLILLQVSIFILTLLSIGESFKPLYSFFIIISLICTIFIVNSDKNPAYKIPWIIIILTFPVVGGIFYVLFGNNKVPRALRGRVVEVYEKTNQYLVDGENIETELAMIDKSISKQSVYLQKYSYYPVYKNTNTTYFPIGEQMFEQMLQKLQAAEHFIFLEYFIIGSGTMWDQIFEVLKQKVKQGVEVRFLYDDFGSIATLPPKFEASLRESGISCFAFNPIRPRLRMQMNNRDHRKILVVDGFVGFTGGINIADEYINQHDRFGHWKDGGIMLEGDAVWNLTVMFLQFWQYVTGQTEDFTQFSPQKYGKKFESNGYVQPFADSPMDDEIVGEQVYLNVINNAKSYVYINTPYLIIDNEMITALTLASKSGIDVRITTPKVPDKWYVHAVTRSYYKKLIAGGVKIYEYTPGFIHTKSFVCDDCVGVVGTTNLDFRSLYLHFECGVWMYQTSAIAQLHQDYMNTLDVCEQVTLKNCTEKNIFLRAVSVFLKLFSPLM